MTKRWPGQGMTNNANRKLQKLARDFFPNCPKLKKYVVTITDELVAGSAEPKSKEIKISQELFDQLSCGTLLPDHLACLLIHELCHIAGSLYHGLVWQNEYERCLDIAKDRGLDRLCAFIESDLRWYQDRRHLTR